MTRALCVQADEDAARAEWKDRHMSITYVAYFGLARLLGRFATPRRVDPLDCSRYHFDRRTRAWVPIGRRPPSVRFTRTPRLLSVE